MSLDDQLRRDLQRAAERVQPALIDNRSKVAEKAVRSERRHRVAVVAGAVLAVVVIVLAVVQLTDSEDRSHSLPPTRPDSLRDPFTPVRTWTADHLGLDQPKRVAAGPDGQLYVTDRSQRVTEISPAGHVIRRWGGPGSGPGQFRMDGGAIAVGPNGRVYVSDSGNFRIQVFSASGKYLGRLGTFGTGAGQFLWPADIAVDGAGAVYVADDRAANISKLAADGRQEWRLGGTGTSDPDLIGHEHLTDFDPAGRLVMANDDSGRVLYLDRSGHKVAAFGSGASGGHESGSHPPGGDFPNGACDTSVDSAGDVFVSSCEDYSVRHHDIEVYDAQHRFVGERKRQSLARAPVFLRDGRAVDLRSDGALVVLRVRLS